MSEKNVISSSQETANDNDEIIHISEAAPQIIVSVQSIKGVKQEIAIQCIAIQSVHF